MCNRNRLRARGIASLLAIGTSLLTAVSAPVAPVVTNQPASRIVTAGSPVNFTVGAVGTSPVGYQWRFNGAGLVDGGRISGAGSAALTISNAQPGDAGGYSVLVTNAAGSAVSAVAPLAVNPQSVLLAQALVLVNSHSARYADFQHFIQPYLDNFGFPYAVQDISTNPPGQSISNYAVLIIGHRQLDTNLTYLTSAVQSNLSLAVSNGTGLVSFDSDLYSGTAGRYPFAQSIFGFTYGSSASGSSVSLPPTQPASQMHFITARHTTNSSITFRASITLPGITVPTNATAVALSGGRPLVAATQYGQGRAVQWGSYDWMVSTVLGPIDGLDDLVWRSVVWSARKPFLMRGLPNLVTMRMDDVAGPLWWAHIANEMGFKPWAGLFMSKVQTADTADLRGLVTNGLVTASIHSFDCCTAFFYFNHPSETAYSDSVMSNNFYIGTQWHATNGIPISKVAVAHYSEVGLNAFAGLKAWGVEFFPTEVPPNTVEYGTPPAPWLIAGPYRLYETPGAGEANLNFFYADFLNIPTHPEFTNQFFDCYVEVRDNTTCNEWCPDNDVAGSIARGVSQVKLELDSMAMGTLFTHEWFIIPIPQSSNQTPITTNNWRAILQGVTNSLGSYNPQYVTLDYASQYVRATRTSRLVASTYDTLAGILTATFSGNADLATQVYVFTGEDNAITNTFSTMPAFSGGLTNTAATLAVSPVLLDAPFSLTNDAGTTANFLVSAGGSAPLAYQWLKNGTNLSDTGNISGSSSNLLTLTHVLGADAASYIVVVTNEAGSISNSPPANLFVNDPIITRQPMSRTNHAGTAATFSVGAYGTTLAYQWQKGTASLSNATAAVLTLPSVSFSDATNYGVQVSSPYGGLLSSPATLTVVAPLQIQSIAVSNGGTILSWNSIPGDSYDLQAKDHLEDSNWTEIQVLTATGSLGSASNSLGNSTQRFFRLLLVP
ncbi:MAG TPA: immunoglobulin domain-containing protein [Candidatus Binatia bacterium]|nr:immunoglobulin domain-containing protein [Candidatus Binatia bacterium]